MSSRQGSPSWPWGFQPRGGDRVLRWIRVRDAGNYAGLPCYARSQQHEAHGLAYWAFELTTADDLSLLTSTVRVEDIPCNVPCLAATLVSEDRRVQAPSAGYLPRHARCNVWALRAAVGVEHGRCFESLSASPILERDGTSSTVKGTGPKTIFGRPAYGRSESPQVRIW